MWAVNVAQMGSLPSKNQGVFWLRFIGIFNKHAWVKPLKDKKVITFLNGFIKIVNRSN